MYKLGFNYIGCVRSSEELTCIYADNYKNSIMLEIFPANFEIEGGDFKMEIPWLAVKKRCFTL